MTDKETAKRLQNILLWCLKNEKSAYIFFGLTQILPLNRQHCCP